jgi:hypothetical protein
MQGQAPSTLDVVRRAVRGVVQSTPELAGRPELRRKLAQNMVGVSLAAAELIDAERRADQEVARTLARSGRARPAAAAGLAAGPGAAPLAGAQAAGDIHRMTAVRSAAGVLEGTRRALDFPGFVTSLITGVFQAMTTSTIQQLEAYVNLLESINSSTSAFAASSITPGRAATWAAAQFPELAITPGDPPALVVRDDADMPEADVLKDRLGATEDEVSQIDDSDLESTLLPLVSRKLARDRQSMLATMVLMGMNRIVVDSGRIHASMELQVDARSTAEQTQAERFDTRVTTTGSGSFGMGMWGASASLSATVGYVRSDEQFTREDIALRAGLRSSVDIGFHTEPLELGRMARPDAVARIRDTARVPEVEANRAPGGTGAAAGSSTSLFASDSRSLLPADTRVTTRPTHEPIPTLPTAPDPGSQEQRDLRARRDFGPSGESGGGGGGGGGGGEGAGTDAAAGGGTDANAGARTDAPVGERTEASAGERTEAPAGGRTEAPAAGRTEAPAERTGAPAGGGAEAPAGGGGTEAPTGGGSPEAPAEPPADHGATGP